MNFIKMINMRNIFFKIFNFFCIVSLALFNSCSDKDEGNGQIDIDDSFRAVTLTPISGVRIAWDYGSMTQLAANGAMPKMLRVDAQTLVAVYEFDGRVFLTKSESNGSTWNTAVPLFPIYSHQGIDGMTAINITNLMTQPTITLLSDGTLVAACAVRYNFTITQTVDNVQRTVIYDYPAAISVRRVNVSNLNMEAPLEVYANLGAEHPSLLQLPDGTLQLYFSNSVIEHPINILSSTELDSSTPYSQHVAVIESTNGGVSWSSFINEAGPDGVERAWSGARVVASRTNRNNIFPAPAIVDKDIVVCLADDVHVTFKPYTVRSPIDENWLYAVAGDSPDREYALFEILPDRFTMNAPAVIILPGGETLLSYQTDEGRNAGFEVMEVAVGDNNAFDFKYRARPFPFAIDEMAIDNSLMLFDERTVVALTSSNHKQPDPEETAPWYMKGYIMNDLTISSSLITEYPIFVSSTLGASIIAGLGVDASNLYISVISNDLTPVAAPAGGTNGDGVYLYIDAANRSLRNVDEGIFKFWVSAEGDVIRWDGKEGVWVEAASSGMTVATGTNPDGGYTLDIEIPRSQLINFNSRGIRFGMAISDYIDKDTGATDMMSLCQDQRSTTWLGVRFPL